MQKIATAMSGTTAVMASEAVATIAATAPIPIAAASTVTHIPSRLMSGP